MESLIQNLRSHVIEASANPNFIHHDWFVEYHLKFVEKIALELCNIYKEADKDIVLALVWIHDYGKILDKSREHNEEMFEKGKEKMIELGFQKEFVDTVISYLVTFENKMTVDLKEAPIEVQIVSSSDAASHLIGPFFAIYYKENNNLSIPELMQANMDKLKKDWERKIVLPEVKKAFEARHKKMLEQAGDFPENFLS